MPPQVVPDEREVKVVLTAHPEVTAVREVTDADSMTRRRVPDQITDLDSPVSVVVQVLQLRKAPFFVYRQKNTKSSQYSTPVYLHSASFVDLRDILYGKGVEVRRETGVPYAAHSSSVAGYLYKSTPSVRIHSMQSIATLV